MFYNLGKRHVWQRARAWAADHRARAGYPSSSLGAGSRLCRASRSIPPPNVENSKKFGSKRILILFSLLKVRHHPSVDGLGQRSDRDDDWLLSLFLGGSHVAEHLQQYEVVDDFKATAITYELRAGASMLESSYRIGRQFSVSCA